LNVTTRGSDFRRSRTALWCAAAVSLATVIGQAQQAPTACAVSGRITSGPTPLPGVSIAAVAADRVIAATSSAPDGSYACRSRPAFTS
jgi:hypothetical protein